jgi:hypothetical protein
LCNVREIRSGSGEYYVSKKVKAGQQLLLALIEGELGLLYRDDIKRFYIENDKRNNKRIPDYHRLDFAWNIYNPGMKNRRWQGHWTFSVYNVYARKNAYSVFFKTKNAVTTRYKLNIFAAPIATIAYNFVF